MRMNVLDAAIAEAERFLATARAAKDKATTRSSFDLERPPYIEAGKYSGAVKRASMDLTRVLVAVRRGEEP